MSIRIALDWPDSQLSPNARVDRRAKANIVKHHRELGWIHAQGHKGWSAERVTLSVQFHPPDKRRRDMDNCYSMCKAYQDGIFQALGMDDRCIERVELRFCKPVDMGAVVFDLEDAEVTDGCY